MAVAKILQHYSEANWNNRLLNAIVAIQAAFIEESDIRASFGRMLESLLELTESEYGFLGEVLHSKEGQPYLVTHALTDISWDEETRQIYEANMAKGFEFHNLNTLFGVTLATGETVISNDPLNDIRGGGLPPGHPGMTNYLGIPIKHGSEMLGMLGIANREGGYSDEIVEALRPLLFTAASMINSVRNMSANRAIELELQEKHELLHGVLNNITDALIITDHTGTISEVNVAAEQIFGHHRQELLGRNICQCLDDEHKKIYSDTIRQFILTGDRAIIEGRREIHGLIKGKEGLPMELTINDIKLGDKKLFVNILQDISERKLQQIKIEKAHQQLKELSETDELTGLYNRRYFEQQFLREFNRSRNSSQNMALAIIDVDYFKSYNDNYGHMKGDQCLTRLGEIFSNYFRRDCEFSARIGGEEFAVVMSNMSREECIGSLQELLELVVAEGITHEQCESNVVTVSIGLSMREKSITCTDEMYNRADRALYQAKAKGRNQLIEACR